MRRRLVPDMKMPHPSGPETADATIQADDTIAEAARRMRELRVRDLVVLQRTDGLLKEVGLLRDLDIVAGIVTWGAPLLARRTVGDILSSAAAAASRGEPASSA
jgi:hypothetical protein